MLLGATIALLAASPAHATLVYNKTRKQGGEPRVFVAGVDGKHARGIGVGHSPAVSSDGRWVAWIGGHNSRVVKLRLADRSRPARAIKLVGATVGDVQFSPDSKWLGIDSGPGLWVYNIHARESIQAASGNLRGFSFSPDSVSVAFGTAGRNPSFEAPSDLYRFKLATERRTRITRDRRSLNPLWTLRGIIHDRQRLRENDSPAFNLFKIHPDGGSLRVITRLHSTPLVSGLVPTEISANGKRLIAELEGQDLSIGFRVNMDTGKAHAISKMSEHAFTAADLTANGRTVLGVTGGADPNNRHDVVTMPYSGGKTKVLVKRAFAPDWNR